MDFPNKRKLIKPKILFSKKETKARKRDDSTAYSHVKSEERSGGRPDVLDDEQEVKNSKVNANEYCPFRKNSKWNEKERKETSKRRNIPRIDIDNGERNEGEYLKLMKKGAVIEITVFNWMVFSGPVTLKAKEGINLIAAANASGKSSLVCALVFGLGYNSSILSRNKELINYIKKGEKKSFIEIKLKKDDRTNTCIKRIMNIIENKVETFWFVNYKKVNFTEIQSIQKEFHLNLDNLITFMPQENVSKFSRLSPEELFECTLLAIDKSLLDKYNYLKKLIQEKKEREHAIQLYEHQIKEEEKLIKDLEEKKGKFENLKKLLAKVKTYRVKKSIIAINMKKEELANVKEKIDNLMKDKDEHFETLKQYLSELEKCHKVINNLTMKHYCEKKKIKDATNRYVKMNVQLEEIEVEIVNEEKIMEDTVQHMYENMEYIKNLDKKRKNIQEEMEKIEEFFREKLPPLGIEKYTNSSSLQVAEEKKIETELNDLTNKNKQFLMRKYALQTEYASLVEKLRKRQNYENIQEEKFLNNIEFALRERIMNYKRNIKNIVQTHELLSESVLENIKKKYDESKITSKNDMNGEIIDELSKRNIIYGPLCRYIKCIKPQFDYVLEFSLRKYFNSFLLIEKENTALLEALYKQYKLSVITMSKENHKFCCVTNEMKERGVECFIYELFESPKIIKNGLINFIPINVSFIVREGTFKNKTTKDINEFNNFMLLEISKQINERVGSLLYFCENNVHRYRISTYDQNVYMDNFSYIDKRCKILYHISHEVKKDIQKLEERKKECESELQILKSRMEELDLLKKRKNDEYNKIILLKNEINIKRKKKIILQKELKNVHEHLNLYLKGEQLIDEKKNAITKCINQLNEKKIKICNDYFDLLKRHKMNDIEALTIWRRLSQWKRYLSLIKSENVENEKKHQLFKNQIEIEKTKYSLLTHDLTELEELLKVQKAELTKEEVKSLKDINISLEQIDNILQECSIQQRIYNNLDKSEEKYNILASSIERHNENVKKKKEEMDNLKKLMQFNNEQIQFILPSWVNQINECIIFLNHNLEKFMNFINSDYSAKIELAKKNDLFEKCQLFIKVKFKKNAPFLLLSVSHQSGGERSLTTMLYILSIQKLTKNGFYVLDELNQGLDNTNEKKIFELLSCLSNPSMYKQHFMHHYDYKYIQIDYHSKPQYFILTPQIIRDIFFKGITVHYLFNGFGVLSNQFDTLSTV
ncbi:SMC family, C-terminal domain containing protein [Plasmodium gonderi]|uniref:Structural maintenance of chromosomes protein 5 n=1 Tax=Plasmodium gonderi TaxID=77519 RepID=A0A1Y1JES6_PLAGO|nr:SMC family, C-terminal domain containing protein [Plasmodium gonderi]GAW81006.1 SMC family, C-terminal domain containing protein [Plasmodium gonderi]